MEGEYKQSGNIMAIVGLVVVVLAKFGVQADAATILTIIGGLVGLAGIIKQWIDHKNLAITTGAYYHGRRR